MSELYICKEVDSGTTPVGSTLAFVNGPSYSFEPVSKELSQIMLAAPDLLSALKTARDAIEVFSFMTMEARDALNECDAAIVKAEGGVASRD